MFSSLQVGVERTTSTALRERAWYGWPTFGTGLPHFLFLLYFFRFATDVAKLDAALVGALFAGTRIWDAVSDTMIAGWSDRTSSTHGRRRPWIAAGGVVLAFAVAALWSTPFIGAPYRSVWVGAGMLLYYAGHTSVVVPHSALAVDWCEGVGRSQLFAARHIAYTAAMVLGLGVMTWLGEVGAKPVAPYIASVGAVLILTSTLTFAFVLKESPKVRPVREVSWTSIARILKSADARRLLVVAFFEQTATASLSVLGPFVAAVLVGDESSLPILLGAYIVGLLFFTPMVPKLAVRFGLHRLWRSGMLMAAIGYASLALIERGAVAPLAASSLVIGVAGSISAVLDRSTLAHVIDQDRQASGGRREAMFFSARTFVEKTAYAACVALTGYALSQAGYTPGNMSDAVARTVRWLIAGVPCVMMCLAWASARRVTVGDGLR
ncbi:MAG: MFS transporter [Myxococcota bacterium]